jgi:hypothetical protein
MFKIVGVSQDGWTRASVIEVNNCGGGWSTDELAARVQVELAILPKADVMEARRRSRPSAEVRCTVFRRVRCVMSAVR